MAKDGSKDSTPEKVVQDIRRKTRRRFSAEEKIRIVLDGLRGEESMATLCRQEAARRRYHARGDLDGSHRPTAACCGTPPRRETRIAHTAPL